MKFKTIGFCILICFLSISLGYAGEKEELTCRQENLQLKQQVLQLQSQLLQIDFNSNSVQLQEVDKKLKKLNAEEKGGDKE